MKMSMFTHFKTKAVALLGLGGSVVASAEGVTYAAPPGLQNAIDTAKATATGMAGDIIPAAVVILFAFAGLIGVYLIWRVFKRGASGR